MSSYLCDVCRSALVDRDYHRYERRDTEAFFITFALLERSAANGCLVCSQLLNRFSPEYRDHLREAARKCTPEQEKKSCVKFSFSYWSPPRVELLAKFNFPNAKDMQWHHLYLVPAEQVESCLDRREISPYTGSAQSLARAAQWLHDSIHQHPSCATRSKSFNPTRLIDLRLEEIPQPRLYEVAANCGTLEYMTLSHCWGGKVPYMLTKSSLKSMTTVIPISELSRTLQDAMTVVRQLGVQYLWADTICIIQDSITDWQEELTRMGDVYKNSACNVAASAASNGDMGCFFNRDSRLIEPCKIQNPSFQDLDVFYCMDRDIWEQEIEDAPLNHRGWVLQELLLSPRTLHFGRNQVFYTCRKVEACEAFPKGLPKTILNGTIKRISDELMASEHNYRECMFAWNEVIEYYSQRELTKDEDKLVAASGLAKEMRSILNDDYLAGIWRKTLPLGLLWKIFLTDVFNTIRYPKYRAPSWSWASLDGKISPYMQIGGLETYYDLAEVQEASVTSDAGDTITHVTGGYVHLKGRLTNCSFKRGGLLYGELWGLTSKGEQKIEGTIEPDIAGQDNEIVQDLYCFPIVLRKQRKPEFDFTECLLLQRAEKGIFQRFGTFSSRWDRKPGTDLLSDACDVFDSLSKCTSWNYEETENGKKYDITIV